VYEYPDFTADACTGVRVEQETALRESMSTSAVNKFFRLMDSTPLVMPAKTDIELLTASDDVIHSFALPSASIKLDAIPGRLNQLLAFFLSCGVFYGQCSELCGVGHGFMPITAQIVNKVEFTQFLLTELMVESSYNNV
jgi:heme/copper-type cytochrome/quinol oxidase subunit 2